MALPSHTSPPDTHGHRKMIDFIKSEMPEVRFLLIFLQRGKCPQSSLVAGWDAEVSEGQAGPLLSWSTIVPQKNDLVISYSDFITWQIISRKRKK